MRMQKVSCVFMSVLMVLFLTGPVVWAAEKQIPTVTVTGHAEMSVRPDVAFITLGVVTAGNDVAIERQENDQAVQRIVEAVTALGIEQNKITTSQFFLQPIYRQQDPKEQATPVISGYRLQNTMIITVEDLAKTSAVIDAVFQAGANQFQGLRFGLRDDKAVRDELLKKAVLDGKRKAGIIADTLGINVGKLISVSETGRTNPVYTGDAPTFKQDAVRTPVEAGSMTVSVNVTLSYEL